MNDNELRICWQDLADYNDGRLRFQWFDLSNYDDFDSFREAVAEFEKIKPHHEEFFIADFEAPVKMGEYWSLADVWKVRETMLELGSNLPSLEDGEIWDLTGEYFCEWEHLKPSEFAENLQIADSVDAWVYDLAQDIYGEFIKNCPYFDYDKFQRDLECDGMHHIRKIGGKCIIIAA